MRRQESHRYVGRGGGKLKYAIDRLGLDLRGVTAADFGCNVGGFTDCMLQEGARHVYAVDTGYGALEWKLRNDERVVAMERTNAMHVELPEPMDVIAIDVGWTRQRNILPNALRQIGPKGLVLSLFKPQYEAPPHLVRRGKVAESDFPTVLQLTLAELEETGIRIRDVIALPRDKRSKNLEAFLHIAPGEGVARG